MKLRVLSLLALLGMSAHAFADEVITLSTRPGVKQQILLWEPHVPSPEAVLLLMPGGPGNIGLQQQKGGQVEATRPYLFARQRGALARPQFAVAVVNAPSDQADMTQEFRISPTHAADMRAVIQTVHQRFPGARLVLLAHSRGTVSAGYAARNFGDQIDGIVLMSGLFHATQPGEGIPSPGPGLSEIALDDLKMPVLLIHHRQDACPVSPLPTDPQRFKPLPPVVIEGGPEGSVDAPCGPGTKHWFTGQESAVGETIFRWLTEGKGRPARP